MSESGARPLSEAGAGQGPATTPLGYYPDSGDRVLVIASAGGSPRHPDWFRNLVATPRVTVETGVFTYEATAVVLDRAARELAFARAVEADPGWAEYQAKTDRTIPVVALRENARPGPPVIDASSPGEAIKAVHDVFRRELGLIRAEFAASGGGTTLGAQLRVSCLTLCAGLGNHHTGEDTALFPFLGDRHPHPAPALDRLRREHERIAALLDGLRRVVSRQDADPVHVLPEVERLTAELEAHLTYEEEQLVPLLG